MLEKKLLEEVKRFNEINKYGKKLISEQAAPDAAIPDAPTPDAPAPDAPAPDAPIADAGAPAPDAAPTPDAGAPAPDATTPDAAAAPADSTEQIDVTDLVDLTKSIKNDLDKHKNDQDAAVSKMDDLFSKLNDLEQKLSSMDNIVAKIDELGQEVKQMKPETPQEKLEMRSLDSYPFNQKPNDFFSQKQAEMKQSGKNEYVLTKDEVTNYPQDIKNTFNPNEEEEVDEYKF
jgi:hypothetical protein